MTNEEYILIIAYSEGADAYRDEVNVAHNPYVGVSKMLADEWDEAWWDMWYSE